MSFLDLLVVQRRLIRVDEGKPQASDIFMGYALLSGGELSCGACGSSKPIDAGTVRSEKTNRVYAYGICAACKPNREAYVTAVDAQLAKMRGEK